MFHFHTKIHSKQTPVCLLMQRRHKLIRANLLGGLYTSGHNCTSKFVEENWSWWINCVSDLKRGEESYIKLKTHIKEVSGNSSLRYIQFPVCGTSAVLAELSTVTLWTAVGNWSSLHIYMYIGTMLCHFYACVLCIINKMCYFINNIAFWWSV